MPNHDLQATLAEQPREEDRTEMLVKMPTLKFGELSTEHTARIEAATMA